MSLSAEQAKECFVMLSNIQEQKVTGEKMDDVNAFHHSIPVLCSKLESKGIPNHRQWGFDRFGCLGIARAVTPHGNCQILLSFSDFKPQTARIVPFSSTEKYNPVVLGDPSHNGWRYEMKSQNQVVCTLWLGDYPESTNKGGSGGAAHLVGSKFSDAMDLDDNSRGLEIPSRGTLTLSVGCTNNRTRDDRTFPYSMSNVQSSSSPQGNVTTLTFTLMTPENCRVYAAYGQPRVFLKTDIVKREDNRFYVVKATLDIRYGKKSTGCSELKNHMDFCSDLRPTPLSSKRNIIGDSFIFSSSNNNKRGAHCSNENNNFSGALGRNNCMDPSKCALLEEDLRTFIRNRIQKYQGGEVTHIQVKIDNEKTGLIKLSSSPSQREENSSFCAGTIFSTIIRIALMYYLGKNWSIKKNDPSFVSCVLLKSCPIGLGEKLKKIYARYELPGPTLRQLFQGCHGLPEFFVIHPERAVDYIENQALDKNSDRNSQHDVSSLFDDICLSEHPGSVSRPSLVADFIIKQILRCLSEDGNENTIIQIITDSIGMKDFVTLNNRDFVYSSPTSVISTGDTSVDLANSMSRMKISTDLPGDKVACLYTPSIFQINNPQGPMMSTKDLWAFSKLFTSKRKSDCGQYLRKICKPRYRINNSDPFHATGYGGWTSFVKSNRLFHEMGYFDQNTKTMVRVIHCPSNRVNCTLIIKGRDIQKLTFTKKKLALRVFSNSDELSYNGVTRGFEVIPPLQAPKLPHYKAWKKYMSSSSLSSCKKIHWLPKSLRTIDPSQLPYHGRKHSGEQLKIMTELADNGCTLVPMFVHPSATGAGGGIDDRVSIVFKDHKRDFIQLIFHRKDNLHEAIKNPRNPFIPLFWDNKYKHFRTHRGDYVVVSVRIMEINGRNTKIPILSVSGSCYTANEYVEKHMNILHEQVKINLKNLCSIKYITHRHSKNTETPTPHGWYSLIGRAHVPPDYGRDRVSSEYLVGRTPSGFTPTILVYDTHITGPNWSPAIGPYGDLEDIQDGSHWGFTNKQEPTLALIQ